MAGCEQRSEEFFSGIIKTKTLGQALQRESQTDERLLVLTVCKQLFGLSHTFIRCAEVCAVAPHKFNLDEFHVRKIPGRDHVFYPVGLRYVNVKSSGRSRHLKFLLFRIPEET